MIRSPLQIRAEPLVEFHVAKSFDELNGVGIRLHEAPLKKNSNYIVLRTVTNDDLDNPVFGVTYTEIGKNAALSTANYQVDYFNLLVDGTIVPGEFSTGFVKLPAAASGLLFQVSYDGTGTVLTEETLVDPERIGDVQTSLRRDPPSANWFLGNLPSTELEAAYNAARPGESGWQDLVPILRNKKFSEPAVANARGTRSADQDFYRIAEYQREIDFFPITARNDAWVTYAHDSFFLEGEGPSPDTLRIWRSFNGRKWYLALSPSQAIRPPVYGNGIFISVVSARSGAVAKSSDGWDWRDVGVFDTNPTQVTARGVGYDPATKNFIITAEHTDGNNYSYITKDPTANVPWTNFATVAGHAPIRLFFCEWALVSSSF